MEKFSRFGGEMSKKAEAWICGGGDNSLVRAEEDSHNYTFFQQFPTTQCPHSVHILSPKSKS